jgi:hypothetical protein
MTRVLYFTGQRELDKSCLRIDIDSSASPVLRCSGVVDGLPEDLPADADVILEAENSMYLHRFHLGSVQTVGSFSGLVLERLTPDVGGKIKVSFRLKVVCRDPDGFPVLLASRAGIKTESDKARGESILPIVGKSNDAMRSELWRVEAGQLGDGDFELWVNSEAGSLCEDIKAGRGAAIALVLPMAVRIILHRVFLDRQGLFGEDVKERWQQMADNVLGIGRIDIAIDEDGMDEVKEWAERFVEKFCTRHALKDMYGQIGFGAAGGEQQ